MTFGQEIREKRVQKCMTLSKVAKAVGISVSNLCDIEQGRRKPFKPSQLKAFSNFLELTKEEAEGLKKLAVSQRDSIEIDSSESQVFNEMVYSLARYAKSSKVREKDEKWEQILKMLGGDDIE